MLYCKAICAGGARNFGIGRKKTENTTYFMRVPALGESFGAK
jgi:hypothetical protein